jgi:hypothetical protein
MFENEQMGWPAGGKRYWKNARKVKKLNFSYAKALRTTLPMVQAGVNAKCVYENRHHHAGYLSPFPGAVYLYISGYGHFCDWDR